MENRKFLIKAALPIALLVILIFYTAVYFWMRYAWEDHFTQWILFYDREIKGFVVDADTGAPIEGAVVVGLWALTQKCHEGFCGYAKIIETATAKDGAFVIPAWRTFKPWKFDCLLHEHAPNVVIYKPGYKVYGPHEIMLGGYWRRQLRMVPQKKMIKDEASITPAKIVKTSSDKEILQSFSEFESQAHFPDNHYSRRQLKTIFSAIEKGCLQLSEANIRSRQKILLDIKEYRKYWVEGKR